MLSGKHIDKINQRLNEALIRRLLVRYFCNHGYSENFDRKLFPPLLQTLVEEVPELTSKIEVVPYVEEIDPQTGYGRVGWNLFVNGNQRLFLGETEHASMTDFSRQVEQNRDGVIGITEDAAPSNKETTPRRVVMFITRVLNNTRHGVRTVLPDVISKSPKGVQSATKSGGDMFSKNQAARPE